MLPVVKSLSLLVPLRSNLIAQGLRAICTSTPLNKTSYLQDVEDYSGIELPERPKLPMLTKVPILPTGVKYTKMQKKLCFMRGPEEVHNALLHGQYGIMALGGGRLRHGHLEMIRLTVGRKMDTSRMFAIWRIDDPWQPVTKRGIGKRHGGGKGNIDHYVTPIKAGRIIIEVGGKCSFAEVQPWLSMIAHILPFKAVAVDHKTMLTLKKVEELKEARNTNPYTFKYLVQNRMCGSQNWLKDIDKLYYGKYE